MTIKLPEVGDRPLLLELLLAKKLIDLKKTEAILKEQTKIECGIEEAVTNTRSATEDAIAECYAEFLNVPLVKSVDADTFKSSPLLRELLPEKFVRDNHLLPLSQEKDALLVAFLDPSDVNLINEVQLFTGCKVTPRVATAGVITQGINILYGAMDQAKQMIQDTPQADDVEVIAKQTEEDVLDLDRIIPESRETKVIRYVNQILANALHERCSDIHLEPFPDECKIRFRIDGGLVNTPPPPMNMFVPVISRLKILCKMDIAEKRVPQDGSFTIKVGDNKIDVRVSTVPTVYGEKMVMRILNKGAVPLDLFKLGFEKRQQEDFLQAAKSPHGLLFVTGPTGSGKSTTLYATLNLVMSPRKNILTVEDPVEYKFSGINQVQVKPQVDLTFARALRAFLRQDPDVIMVGEVRDNETAQICLKAALTGHFVLSTLHTNSALSAVSRLNDMGIEPFLLAATLRLVEAQRLIRRLCPACKEPYKVDQKTIDKYGFAADSVFYKPKGCKECRDVGYKGRVGIFEVIRITPVLRGLIQEKAPLAKLEETALAEGMQTLAVNGLERVKDGLTSLEEVVTSTTGE